LTGRLGWTEIECGVRRVIRQIRTKNVKQVIIEISEVKVMPGRRAAKEKHVRELADSISSVGLLNPITVDRSYTLIAGLHRPSVQWRDGAGTAEGLDQIHAVWTVTSAAVPASV